MKPAIDINDFWRSRAERARRLAESHEHSDEESSHEALSLHPGEVFWLRDTSGTKFPLIYTVEHGDILLRFASASEVADEKTRAPEQGIQDSGLRRAVRLLSSSAIVKDEPRRRLARAVRQHGS